MTRTGRILPGVYIIGLCLAAAACASTPEPDRRPALVQSAEKSLELGVGNYRENDFARAEAHFMRALQLYRSIDNPEGIVSSCLNLAKTRLQSGQVGSAAEYAEQAQRVSNREKLNSFDDHIALIKSSIAIETGESAIATELLDALLQSKTPVTDNAIRTAALQNRTRAAFASNTGDAADWTQQYADALKQPGQNTQLNRARLLRFEAALQPEQASQKLQKALELYRESAHRPGIAATLTEWATFDAANDNHNSAVDKLLRALYIRAGLHDDNNSKRILTQLEHSYTAINNSAMSKRARLWQDRLDKNNSVDWNRLLLEYNNFPGN